MIQKSPRTDHIGIYAYSLGDITLVSDSLRDSDVKTIEETLDTSVIKTRIGGTTLIGIFVTGVREKIVVPWITYEEEIRTLEKEGLEVLMLKDRVTALGNLFSINSKGGVVSPSVSKRAKKIVEEFLGIPLSYLESDIDVLGASIVANDKGFIAHPSLENHIKTLEEIFNVKGVTTTVNKGDPFVRNGVVANNKGAVVGSSTTPVELLKIEDVWGV